MHKERLLTLAKFLEGLPKHKFMFDTWMEASDEAVVSWNDADEKYYRKALQSRQKNKSAFKRVGKRNFNGNECERAIVEPNLCQTVGCALGWAATIPEFKKAGLRLVSWQTEGMIDDSAVVLFDNPRDLKNSPYLRDIEGAAKFFDIDKETSQQLFLRGPPKSTSKYTTGKDVAKMIRKLVKQGHLDWFQPPL